MEMNKKDPNKNADNMGGPSFHPDITADVTPDIEMVDRVEKPKKLVLNEKGEILDENQVPPL